MPICKKSEILQWPTGANALQLINNETHANRKNTSKLRKHLHKFDNTCAAFSKHAANTHNKNKYINKRERERFIINFIWLNNFCFYIFQIIRAWQYIDIIAIS